MLNWTQPGNKSASVEPTIGAGAPPTQEQVKRTGCQQRGHNVRVGVEGVLPEVNTTVLIT